MCFSVDDYGNVYSIQKLAKLEFKNALVLKLFALIRLFQLKINRWHPDLIYFCLLLLSQLNY